MESLSPPRFEKNGIRPAAVNQADAALWIGSPKLIDRMLWATRHTDDKWLVIPHNAEGVRTAMTLIDVESLEAAYMRLRRNERPPKMKKLGKSENALSGDFDDDLPDDWDQILAELETARTFPPALAPFDASILDGKSVLIVAIESLRQPPGVTSPTPEIEAFGDWFHQRGFRCLGWDDASTDECLTALVTLGLEVQFSGVISSATPVDEFLDSVGRENVLCIGPAPIREGVAFIPLGNAAGMTLENLVKLLPS